MVEYGHAIIPALLMRMSRRVSERWKVEAASAMEEKDVKSSGKWMISQALGTEDLMAEMADSAFDAVRAAR